MSKTTSTTVAHVNGIDLSYQDLGTGSPVILLHGGFGSVVALRIAIQPPELVASSEMRMDSHRRTRSSSSACWGVESVTPAGTAQA